MWIQGDRGFFLFFFRPERQEVQIALLGVNQLWAQAQEAACGDWWRSECWAPLPPPASFPWNFSSEKKGLMSPLSQPPHVNITDARGIRNSLLGPYLSFHTWETEAQRKGVRLLFDNSSVNKHSLEPSLWKFPPTKVTGKLERGLWLPLWLWFRFEYLMCGLGQVI